MSFRFLRTVRLYSAVTISTLVPIVASAAPIVQNTVDTETVFTAVGSGTAYSTLKNFRFANYFSPSGFWFLSLGVDENQSAGNNDVVTVSGTVQHIKSPTGHGDGVGPVFPFSMSINAAGPLTDSAGPTTKVHGAHPAGDHHDTMSGNLSGTATGIIFHDFTGYEFSIDVRHCSSPCPVGTPLPTPITLQLVPEPTTSGTFVIASAVVYALRRKLRRT